MILKKFFPFLLLVASCANIPQPLDPKTYYQHDLEIKVNGDWTKGVEVIPKRKQNKFKVKSPGQMDLLIMETCHQQQTYEDAGKREKIWFHPAEGIEDKYDCAMIKFSSFDRTKKAKHAESILIQENERFTVDAVVFCNGRKKFYGGTSVCHAKEGLMQRILFKEEVTIKGSTCGLTISGYTTDFYYKLPNRECSTVFTTRDKRLHYLFSSGYEEPIIREP